MFAQITNFTRRSTQGGYGEGTTANSDDESEHIDDLIYRTYEAGMREKLTFFFMNPVEKWRIRQKIPYKLGLQIVKIFVVTFQLWLFANNRYTHVHYGRSTQTTFSHLFLKGWDPSREVNSYPQSSGPLAVYTRVDFFAAIDYALKGYNNLSTAIGTYSYTDENNSYVPPLFCGSNFKIGKIFGFNESYDFNGEIIEYCCPVDNNTSHFVGCPDHTPINFQSLTAAKLNFSLKTVNFESAGFLSSPDCYKFDVEIIFDNGDMDGQMLLSMSTQAIRLTCRGDVEYVPKDEVSYIAHTFLNLIVIVICAFSFVLCSRSLITGWQLRRDTEIFFQRLLHRKLSQEGRCEFINLWYVMILINDVLIIFGTCLKEEIERKHFNVDQWNFCSLFLGTGNLLVWFGVLRYLGFFNTYNVIILTLKTAFPKVIRFLICAALIYAGFTFCGWLVLGPYHPKFRTVSTTSECLFAIINGDDLYGTFSLMNFKSSVMWWYARIYLYLFISLYIYVVLSLFISIIMDAYETIKIYYAEGFPKNDLQRFISLELRVMSDSYPPSANAD